ncbi:MAG: DNA polymerase III subunit gamma/tau [Clostridia bacterium]|nr:DNA polymerase III subunit gamma/tau [Clostridia bacterium]
MAYMALYRAWRPTTFDEVVEQDLVITILKNAVIQNRIAHAYLFCGTRGTGKTTMAKIFSRAINCLNPRNGNPCNECDVCKGILNGSILDVTEIDAASNNGVDNIRDIIEETAYATSVAKYKVYIIDEVHMLSTGAFNALLKTLEEPPEGVVFILATTEPQKLPSTIISRCQRYDFKRISHEGIISRLRTICDAQAVQYEDAALGFIAQKADGALRDAISMLDQTMSSTGTVTLNAARQMTGSVNKEVIDKFAEYILKSDTAGVISVIDTMFTDGRDPATFIVELMNVFRNIAITLVTRDTSKLIYEDEAGFAKLKEFARMTTGREVTMIIMELSRLENNLKWASSRRIVFEAGMIALCDRRYSSDANDLTQRITYLEDKLDEITKKLSALKRSFVSSPAEPSNPPMPPLPPEPTEAPMPPLPPEPAEAPMPPVPPMPADTPKPQKPQTPPMPPMPPKPAKQVGTSNVKRTTGGTAPTVDELDWKDFLSNISREGFASISGIINSCSKGVLADDGTLALIFNSPMSKNMIEKQNRLEVLKTAASSAYARPMNVILLGPTDPIPASVPAIEPATESETVSVSDESFLDSVNILKQLASDGDFTITEE